MNVDRYTGKKATLAPVCAIVFLFALLLASTHLAAQTLPPAQPPPREGAGTRLPALPKWIENATVDLEFKDAAMATLLDKIHEETGITILMEGAPARIAASLSFHGALKSALDQIAETFDYLWAPSKRLSRSLLLKKRFRSPEEHPQWHEKEMLHVAQEVCRALQSPLSISESYGNPRELLQLLYHKLSPQQLTFLYQGGELSFHDLDDAQTLLLNQDIYSVALGGTTDAWQHLQHRLAHLKDAKLVLRPSDTYKALTLVFPPDAGGAPDAVLVRYYTNAAFAPNSPQFVPPVHPQQTAPLSVEAGAAQNGEQEPLQRRLNVRMQEGRLTDLLRAVSQRSECKITVADYLQEQTLSLWTKQCSVRLLMDLLAEQNEWKWSYVPETGVNISRRDTFVPLNLSEVSAAFLIALPPSYRHFLGWGVSTDDWLKGSDDPTMQAYRAIPGGDVIAMRLTVGRKAIQNDYNDPVMLRIWPTRPQPFPNGQELNYKDWTSQTKEAVLASLFGVALGGFFGVGRGIDVIEGRLTPYEVNPELLRLHLDGFEDGMYHSFSYNSSIIAPNGQANYMGFSWTLKNIADPLPPLLEEISKRY